MKYLNRWTQTPVPLVTQPNNRIIARAHTHTQCEDMRDKQKAYIYISNKLFSCNQCFQAIRNWWEIDIFIENHFLLYIAQRIQVRYGVFGLYINEVLIFIHIGRVFDAKLLLFACKYMEVVRMLKLIRCISSIRASITYETSPTPFTNTHMLYRNNVRTTSFYSTKQQIVFIT